MAKVYPHKHSATGQIIQYWFYCPGCKFEHAITTAHYLPSGNPVWTFNGDLEKPTFSPSLLCNGHVPSSRCHLYVKEGKLEFLSDSYHELAGKTVDMEDYEGFGD